MHTFLIMLKNNRLIVIWSAITLGLIVLSYSGITNQQILNWDDADYLLKNQRIKSFSLDNILWMFSDFSMANWHPLTWMSYTFNYIFWGNNPTAYKVINIILHTINCILVYLFTYKILLLARNNYGTKSGFSYFSLSDKDLVIGGLFSATLFAIHPLHVESVSWISERKDVLYSLFFLMTFLSYIKYRESKEQKSWFIISILMFLCSLMSKPMAVTMPVLLILIDIYPLNLLKNKRNTKDIFQTLFDRKITFIILGVLVSLITILTQKSGIQDTGQLGIESRLINACLSILLYIHNYFLPFNLSTFYSFHPWSTDPNIYSILPVAIVVFVTTGFIYLAFRKRIIYPLISWLFFLLSLFPVIGIVKVGAQAAADRYTYIPLLSVFIISGAAAAMIYNASKKSFLLKSCSVTLCVFIYASFSYFTYKQNNYWKDDYTLWTRAVEYSPGTAAVPYNNLGAYYFRRGESQLAIMQFNKALAIQPDDITTMTRIGKAYELMHKETLAIHAYQNIIDKFPHSATGFLRLGDLFYRMNSLDQAKMYYRKAFTLSPTAPSTLQRSALVDYMEQDYASAEQKLIYLQQLRPNDRGGLQLLAQVLIKTGRINEAKNVATVLLNNNRKDKFANEILQLAVDSPAPDSYTSDFLSE